MDKHQKSLDLLDEFFRTHSKEEINALFNEVDQMQFDGPKIQDYFDNFASAFEFHFETGETMPAPFFVHKAITSKGDKNIQVESFIVSPLSNTMFVGSLPEFSFQDDHTNYMPQAS